MWSIGERGKPKHITNTEIGKRFLIFVEKTNSNNTFETFERFLQVRKASGGMEFSYWDKEDAKMVFQIVNSS